MGPHLGNEVRQGTQVRHVCVRYEDGVEPRDHTADRPPATRGQTLVRRSTATGAGPGTTRLTPARAPTCGRPASRPTHNPTACTPAGKQSAGARAHKQATVTTLQSRHRRAGGAGASCCCSPARTSSISMRKHRGSVPSTPYMGVKRVVTVAMMPTLVWCQWCAPAKPTSNGAVAHP